MGRRAPARRRPRRHRRRRRRRPARARPGRAARGAHRHGAAGRTGAVAGGCVDPGCESATATTELYDPVRRRFARGPRLSRPRVGHAALPLRDGSVLVLGGWSGGVPTANGRTARRRTVRRDRPDALPARRVHGDATARRPRPRRGRDERQRDACERRAVRPRHGPVRRDRQPREVAQRPHRDAASRRAGSSSSGGSDGVDVLRTAEVYDPASRPFLGGGRAARRHGTSTRPSSSATVACSSSAARTCATSEAGTARPSCGAPRRADSPGAGAPRAPVQAPRRRRRSSVRRGRRRRRRRDRRAPPPGRPLRAGGRRRRAVHVRDRDRRCRAGACSWPAATTTRSRRRRAPGCTGPR